MAIATDQIEGEILLTGDFAVDSSAYSPRLVPTGVTPDEYVRPTITIDEKGRILKAFQGPALTLPCATETDCGGVRVTGNHDVYVDEDGEMSLKIASATEYGVVKIGDGFIHDCCEINVDYVEATETVLGVVTVPLDGNLKVDFNGNLSVPVATSEVAGILRVDNSDPTLVMVGNTISYDISSVQDATKTDHGLVQVGNNFNVAAGLLSVPAATFDTFGVFRFNSSFGFSNNTYSYTTVATENDIGFVKIGTRFARDPDGTLNRADGADATTESLGLVQVTESSGLTINDAVIAYDSSPATSSTLGTVKGSSTISINNSTGEMGVVVADGATKGVLTSADQSLLKIEDGLISIGPRVVQADNWNIYTKAQVSQLVNIIAEAESPGSTHYRVTLDLSSGNVIKLTVPAIATQLTISVFGEPRWSGGQYTLIVQTLGTNPPLVYFTGSWRFTEVLTDTGASGLLAPFPQRPGAISLIKFTIKDYFAIAHIERDYI